MSFKSIKSLLPRLESALGVEGSAIYERQRALVREKVLKARAGQGPGSGVIASPRNLSLLLLAMMAADNPAKAAERVRDLAALVPARTPRYRHCVFTRQDTLLDALVYILSQDDYSDIPVLTVSGTHLKAKFLERGPAHMGNEGKSQVFLPADGSKMGPVPRIEKSASFDLVDLASVLNFGGDK